VKVHIVGPNGSHDILAQRLLASGEMAIRPTVVYNHLLVRHQLWSVRQTGNDAPPPIALPDVGEILEALRDVPKRLRDGARCSADLSVEERLNATYSDPAGVRAAVTAEDSQTSKEPFVTDEARQAQEEALKDETATGFDLGFDVGFAEQEGEEGQDHHRCDAGGSQTSELHMERVGLMNAATTGEAVTQATIDAVAKELKIERSEHPCSEFAGNGRNLMKMFWYLFPLGRGLEKFEGTIPMQRTRHLMQHFSNRFQRDAGLLFVLANQAQRHAVLRSVSAKVRSERSMEFVELASSPDFLRELEEAAANPNSRAARRIMRVVLPLVAACGRPSPWGAMERSGCIGQMLAMARRYGPPGLFLTMAPDDVHNPLGYRLTIGHGGNGEFPAIPDELLKVLRGESDRGLHEFDPLFDPTSNQEDHLQAQAARNPASTSMMFNRLMRAVLKVLVGIPVSDESKRSVPFRDRERGLFGLGVAFFGVVEETGKGAHHLHCIVWCGAMPGLCSGAAHDAQLLAALTDALDEQYKCELPLAIHLLDCTRRALGVKMFRAQFQDPPPITDEIAPTASSSAGDAEIASTASSSAGDAEIAPMTSSSAGSQPPAPQPGLGKQLRRSVHLTAVGKQMHCRLDNMEQHDDACHKAPAGDVACRMNQPNPHPIKQTRALLISAVNMEAQEKEFKKKLEAQVAPKDPAPIFVPRFSDHELPRDQITCGTAPVEPGMEHVVHPLPCCWPRKAGGRSLLNTGDLWLSVKEPARETEALRAAARARAAGEGAAVEDDEEGAEGEEGDAAEERSALARLLPRDEEGSVVMELQRQMLAWEDCPPPLEKPLEQLKGEELKTTWDSWYASFPTDVRDELERPEWAEVKAKLESLDVAELNARTEAVLRRLLKAWAHIPCANSVLTCFNEVLTAVLQCNTAPYLLGSRESSRAAMFYLVKYLTKDSVALKGSLSTLVDAKKNIDRWKSTADDEGTDVRSAAQFLQRATNSYQAEVHDTQAASLLLGFHAALSSERFVYSAGWDYVRDGLEYQGKPPRLFAHYVSDNMVGEAEDEEEDMAEIGRDSEWAREKKENEFEGLGVPGTARVYQNEAGQNVPVKQSVNYRFRGRDLEHFNVQEYEACIKIVQRTPEEIRAKREEIEAAAMEQQASRPQGERTRAGRRPNAQVRATP
jgi:hypothetical protein